MTQIKHPFQNIRTTLARRRAKRRAPNANELPDRTVFPVRVKFSNGSISLLLQRGHLSQRARLLTRLGCLLSVALLLVTIIIPIIEHKLDERNYNLTSSETALLPAADSVLAKNISYNPKTGGYQFQNRSAGADQAGSSSIGSNTTMLSAQFPAQASDGVSVTDPVNNVVFKVKPAFDLASARRDSSHVYYPFLNGTGQLVYSPQASNVLEDLVLKSASGDTQHFDYKLDLGNTLAARLMLDGSVNIYGSSLSTLGNISTGDSKDAALLQKAQTHAKKDKLLFSIPVPTIREAGTHKSAVKATYALLDHGTTLRVEASNLSHASYPLDIDPTVSVSSVAQLFRDTNGESNVDFNTTNGTINRGAVTGGIFSYTNGWSTNGNSTATGHFGGSATISNGYAYVGGGISGTGTTNQSSLEYAQINTSDNTVGAWSTASLPTALSAFKLLSYNGYLYSLGGTNGSTVSNASGANQSIGCTNPTTSVYYNPTQPNGAVASTWTSTTALPAAICNFGAAIYNNTIYVVGGYGQNLPGNPANGSYASTTTVYYASILPNGSIGAWQTSPVSLPTNTSGEDVQIYNGYIYAIGGANLSAQNVPGLNTTIYRAALNADGSIYGTSSSNWLSLPNTFGAADGSKGIYGFGGGNFTTVNDGYMYVSGGCMAIGMAHCTTVNGSTYIAQINADGTLGPWSVIASTNTDTETGGTVLAFGNYLYVIGGCTATGNNAYGCTGTTLTSQYYTAILSAGQIGPVSNGDSMPAVLFEESAVVNNGYLYIIGGCLSLTCQATTGTNTSQNVYYAALNADGSVGTWNTSSFTINATGTTTTQGIAAAGAAVYNNYIYLFGGYSYGGASRNIWYAPINPATGNITANFASYGTTPIAAGGLYSSAVLADRGYIYSFGGCYAATKSFGCSTYITTTYRLAVGASGPTAVASGTGVAPTLPTTRLGTACTNIYTAYPGDCYPGSAAMGVALYNGYVYLAGGASAGNGQSVVVEYAKISGSGTVGAWTAATNYLPTAVRRTAAYAYNGYLYVIGGHDGDNNVTQQTVDIGKINLATGNLNDSGGIFASSSQLNFKEWDGTVVFSNGSIYEAGGCTVGNPPTSCSTIQPTTGGIQSFQVYNANNGGTATWNTASNSYATNVTGGSAVATGGYIYNAGGCTAYTFSALGPCTAVTTATSYAQLNPDGSVGAWTAAPALPVGSGYGCMVAANGYLYYIAGVSAANVPTAAVYISQIGSSGVPGSWTAGTSLTAARGHPGCDTFDGTIYVAGGASGSSNTAEGTDNTTVYYAQPSASTGAISSWTTGTAFTTGRRDASVVAAGGYLYIIGGYSSSGYYNDVQFNSITPSTGALSATWSTTRALPNPLTQAVVTAANGYIFVSGGASGATTSTCQASTYIASINNTGELSTWTQGANATNFSTARFGATGAYYNGYYYVLGGYGCAGSAIVSSNVIQYGGEQSQSMNSFFTRYADLTGNALPQKFVAFVTNAQVNSTDIESWKMAYVTSNTANNSWGKTTTISPVTSQSVYTVYAYDGSGNNVQLAQWVSLAFSISMEKSFTFTDDTQPYVSAYYMYYSPYAGSRLRNGKTFQDQQQQGLDLNLH